jgi:spermidine/putrescine-binding protein
LNLEESEFAAVEEKMRQLRSNARFIWTEPSQLEQALASGEVDVAWGWPNSFASLRKQNVNVNVHAAAEGRAWSLAVRLHRFPASSDATEEQVYDLSTPLKIQSPAQPWSTISATATPTKGT